ncbi:MAG TPA: TIGR00730 family Rossman fold protein [Thauera sp.]|nr:TIGR00730 family Rossman fold protein [Dokdonella sp.]HQZ02208.1 TIGR00730 family Rossman fold protein [Thauera sp.]
MADPTDPTQLEAMQQAIMQGAAYRLAQDDAEFLASDESRPLRMQLELLKPEHDLREQGIASTVVVFGSARVVSANLAQAALAEAEARVARRGATDPASATQLATARHQLEQSRYYEEARRLGNLVSSRFQQEGRRDFVVVTGGGPGIMEAANRGAHEAGARSIGLNIILPHEQRPNPYISPELAFRFHYFALRKMHFLMRARALVAFPGGFGTLDELFDVLTLVQTGKMPRIPIVLVGSEFWRRVIDFDYLVEEGYISAADADLFTRVDKAEEVIDVLSAFHAGKPPDA